MSAVFNDLERMLATAAIDLFEAHGAATWKTPSVEQPHAEAECIVATIGFAVADGSKGSLVMVASPAAIAALHTPDGDEHSEMILCDILGEFSNMLLGRLKNILLPRGVTLMLGTPTTAYALKLRLSSPFSPCRWLAFVVNDHVIRARLDVALAKDFPLADDAAGPSTTAREGEMILF